jgi:hypothetical protein
VFFEAQTVGIHIELCAAMVCVHSLRQDAIQRAPPATHRLRLRAALPDRRPL